MGDIADMAVQGITCQECGCFFDEDDWPDAERRAEGYARWCYACGGDPETNGASKRKGYKEKQP